MPRYYCDYCDAYLTHDSVRRVLLVVFVILWLLWVVKKERKGEFVKGSQNLWNPVMRMGVGKMCGALDDDEEEEDGVLVLLLILPFGIFCDVVLLCAVAGG